MSPAELEYAAGRCAGLRDWLRGRSYAELGEDEANDPWYAGYADGWNFGGAEDFRPERPTEAGMVLRSQAEANRAAERVGWVTIHHKGDQS